MQKESCFSENMRILMNVFSALEKKRPGISPCMEHTYETPEAFGPNTGSVWAKHRERLIGTLPA